MSYVLPVVVVWLPVVIVPVPVLIVLFCVLMVVLVRAPVDKALPMNEDDPSDSMVNLAIGDTPPTGVVIKLIDPAILVFDGAGSVVVNSILDAMLYCDVPYP